MPDEFPLTRVLARDVPGGSRTKGRLYHLDGAVARLEGDAWHAKATVRGSHEYRVRIDRHEDAFEASCECPYFLDRADICKHIWATLLDAERRGLLLGDGTLGTDASLDPAHPDADNDPESRLRHPAHLEHPDHPKVPRPRGSVSSPSSRGT